MILLGLMALLGSFVSLFLYVVHQIKTGFV